MSLANIVILRYQTHGRRFEVPCFRNRVDEYLASGREEPPTQVEKMVAFPGVFFNCHRKQQATNSSLQEAFHTVDFASVASIILQRGEIMLNDKDRMEKRAEQRDYLEKSYHLTQELLRNRFTGEQPEFADVREEIQLSNGASSLTSSTAVLPHPLALASFFAFWIVSRGNLFCDRVTKKGVLRCSLQVEGEWNDFFLLMNGMLLPLERSIAASGEECILTFLYDSYMDRDNSLTRPFHELVSKSISFEHVSLSQSEVDLFNRQDVPFPHFMNSEGVVGKPSHAPSSASQSSKKQPARSEEDESEVESHSVSKYEAMTHKQLQDLCRQKKLSTGGKKHDLVDRLEALDETPVPKRK